MKLVLIGLILLSHYVEMVSAGVTSGMYRGSETWIYLDRFVFNPVKTGESMMGRLEMELDFAKTDTSFPALMLYYKGGEETGVKKEFGVWERVYNQDLICEEKALIAQQRGGIYLPLPGGRATEEYVDEDGVERWKVKVVTNMNTNRARWMFISVGNCQPYCTDSYCAGSLDFKYTMNLTNGNGNSMYFSADRSWFLEMSIAFTVFYAFLFIFAMFTRHVLLKEQKYHYSVQLLVGSIFASTSSAFCFSIVYSHYASSGEELPILESFAIFLGLVAEFELLLMCILVAKGWTIVRRKISALGRVRIAAYMTLYIVTSVASWVYFMHFTDPADIVYIYGTVPGVLLVVLRCFAFVWFTYAIYVTLRKYRQKNRFYKKFWLFVGGWILTLPFLLLINSVIDAWYRAKVVALLSNISIFVCQAVLILMYNSKTPFGWNKNFPFHATTNTFIKSNKSAENLTGFRASNTFEEAHLLRAFQISTQMRHSVVMLQSYTNDLYTFLDDIRQKNKPIQADLEAGLLNKPSVVVDTSVKNASNNNKSTPRNSIGAAVSNNREEDSSKQQQQNATPSRRPPLGRAAQSQSGRNLGNSSPASLPPRPSGVPQSPLVVKKPRTPQHPPRKTGEDDHQSVTSNTSRSSRRSNSSSSMKRTNSKSDLNDEDTKISSRKLKRSSSSTSVNQESDSATIQAKAATSFIKESDNNDEDEAVVPRKPRKKRSDDKPKRPRRKSKQQLSTSLDQDDDDDL